MSAILFNNEVLQYREKSKPNSLNRRHDFAIMRAQNENGGQRPSSDTQWGFRSLHQPLGQLARKALNLPPKIDTKRYSVRSNQITALL